MSLKRDRNTNIYLQILSNLVNSPNDGLQVPVTLNVSGQLISGIIIKEEEFYNLELNGVFKPIYEALLTEKKEFFNEDGTVKDHLTEEEIEKIPDAYCQKFIYLKNARYISGSVFLPSEDSDGAAISIRLSDVSSYSFGTFSANKS